MFDFRKLLTAKAPTIPELTHAADQLRRDAAEAEAEVRQVESERRNVLLTGTDADLKKREEQVVAANRRRDRAAAALEEITAKLAAAKAHQVEAERQALYDGARDKAAKARAALEEVYPQIVETARDLLRNLAEAEIAVARANQDRPNGAQPLDGPERFRIGTGAHERIISTKRVELWADRVGRPLSEEKQPHVVTTRDGFGYIPNGKPGAGLKECRKLVFNVETYQPAASMFRFTERLAVTLALPGLRPGDAAGWEPVKDSPQGSPELYPRSVLELLGRLERHPGTTEKAPAVRHTLVNPGDLYKAPADVTTTA